MNHFDGLLTNDFAFKPQAKSAPMNAKSVGSSSNFDDNIESSSGYSDNRKKFETLSKGSSDLNDRRESSSGFSGNHKKREALSFDDIFGPSSTAKFSGKSQSVNETFPVYDKPIYDDDDDILVSGGFDDLLGGFGKVELKSKSLDGKRMGKSDRNVNDFNHDAFDDLLGGFGGKRAHSDRYGKCCFCGHSLLVISGWDSYVAAYACDCYRE